MDYEYTPMHDYTGLTFPVSKLRRRRPSLRVEVTRSPVGYGDFIATFFRDHTCTAYALSPRRYDRLVELANSGQYAVEILDSDWGVAWQMRRKEATR